VSESRAATRHPVSLGIEVRVGEEVLDGAMLNLSLGGTRVELDRRLTIGTKVRLSFRLPGNQALIDVDGEVRWSSDVETGFQFGSLRAREVWELNRFFESERSS
jgi:hypothetical protein